MKLFIFCHAAVVIGCSLVDDIGKRRKWIDQKSKWHDNQFAFEHIYWHILNLIINQLIIQIVYLHTCRILFICDDTFHSIIAYVNFHGELFTNAALIEWK